nr:hypothetical protein [Xanthomonas sp. SHU 308]
MNVPLIGRRPWPCHGVNASRLPRARQQLTQSHAVWSIQHPRSQRAAWIDAPRHVGESQSSSTPAASVWNANTSSAQSWFIGRLPILIATPQLLFHATHSEQMEQKFFLYQDMVTALRAFPLEQRRQREAFGTAAKRNRHRLDKQACSTR